MPISSDTRATLRRRIVEAADAVIRERGLAGATTREIARAAGCSEGSLYVHFEDKIELVLAVIVEREPSFAALLELPARAGEGTVESNLALWAEELTGLLADNLPIFLAILQDRALFARFAQRLHERRTGPLALADAAAAYVDAEQERGRITAEVDPLVVATILIGACRDFAFTRLLQPEPLSSAEAFARHLARTLVAGLVPAPRTATEGGTP